MKILKSIFGTSGKINSYYYTRLSGWQKTAYISIMQGIISYSKKIKIAPMSSNEIALVYNYILMDNPMIFQTSSYSLTSSPEMNKYIVAPIYKYSKGEAREYENAVMEYLKKFDAVKSKSDTEKELFIHDYCVKKIKYDYSFGEHAYSVLGVVLNNTAVCEGIAKFVKLALNYLGVKCLVVSGEGRNPVRGEAEKHAWNIVKLGDNSYHLDVTFDLCLSDRINRYDYFNLSDDDIKRDHVIISDSPKCASLGSDYYSISKQVVNSPKEMKNYIADNLRHGNKSILFKIANADEVDNIEDRVLNAAIGLYEEIINENGNVELHYNIGQMIFEVNFS